MNTIGLVYFMRGECSGVLIAVLRRGEEEAQLMYKILHHFLVQNREKLGVNRGPGSKLSEN